MLWSLIIFVIGMLVVAFPKSVWKLECLLNMKRGEPSAEYLRLCRIGGVLLAVVAIVLVIRAFGIL